jgi:phage-related holin
MLAAIFAPIQAVLITTMVLIGVDFVTGIVAARKRGEVITSSGFRRTISKLVVYELALVVGFLAERYMMPMLPVCKMVSSLIALTEIKSIYENLDSASGGDLLKSIVSKIGSDNGRRED